ncbi:MAG: hypothetical protein HGA35_03155, partial [Erysipelotrichaceae bacterium]|nr:hypothetical protein [Erysipelotrichaceae bacterium]
TNNQVTNWIKGSSTYKNENIDIVHNGEGNFSINVCYANGNCGGMFSGTGNIDTTISRNLYPEFFLEVISSGTWSIDFNQGEALTIY